MILLDTCALLWLVNSGGKLTQTALEEIDRAPEVYISAISGFEISLKYHKGKLGLPLKPRECFKMAVEHHKLSVISLDVETCIASTNYHLSIRIPVIALSSRLPSFIDSQ